jgi:hypothetical protein
LLLPLQDFFARLTFITTPRFWGVTVAKLVTVSISSDSYHHNEPQANQLAAPSATIRIILVE